MADDFSYKCSTCNQIHTGLPDLAFDSPVYYSSLTDDEKKTTAVLTSDTCIISNEDRFIRGCLEIPVHGRPEGLIWGVWVSLSEKNFTRYNELYERDRVAEESPYFGWLSNQLPGYPDTLNLKTHVYLRPNPTRPRIQIEPTDHPLAVEQRTGISIERLRQIIEVYLHPTNQKETVQCSTHGGQEEAFVCQHLLDSKHSGQIVGFFSSDPTGLTRGDAWCAACEKIRVKEGGDSGDWNERSEAFASIKLLCGLCYDHIKSQQLNSLES